MAWLIVRIYDDRQGRNLVQVAKKHVKGRAEASDIDELCTLCSVETQDGAKAARREWPWSVTAHTSRSRDGIGRSTGLVRLAARPKRKAAP